MAQWAADKGWQSHKNVVYGRQNGYTVTAYSPAWMNVFGFSLGNATVDQKKGLLAALRSNRKSLYVGQTQIQGDVLIVFMKTGLRLANGERMEALVDGIAGLLAENNIPADRCAICGAEDARETMFHKGHAKRVCGGWAARLIGESDPDGFAKTLGRSYLTGAVGAVLGGLVAAVPWVLIGTLLELVTAFAGCLVAWGSIKGYRLLKGRVGPGAVWIIGVASAVCVFVAQMGIWAVALAKEGIPVTLGVLQGILVIPEMAEIVWKDLTRALIFGVAGVIIVLSRFATDTAPVERLPI
jgi:hypothetical protein